mgnify:CR=1 FL=1
MDSKNADIGLELVHVTDKSINGKQDGWRACAIFKRLNHRNYYMARHAELTEDMKMRNKQQRLVAVLKPSFVADKIEVFETKTAVV